LLILPMIDLDHAMEPAFGGMFLEIGGCGPYVFPSMNNCFICANSFEYVFSTYSNLF